MRLVCATLTQCFKHLHGGELFTAVVMEDDIDTYVLCRMGMQNGSWL